MRAQIPVGSGAATSKPFHVRGDESIGVKAYGFSGSENIVIQVDRGDGEFQDIIATSGTLTSTAYQTTISAEGTYRLYRASGAAGASAG